VAASQTVDGYGDHALVNGTVALLQSKGLANVRQFGAKGDEATDDTTAIQAAINSGYSSLYFSDGTYIVSSALTLVSNQGWLSDGASTIKAAVAHDGNTSLIFKGNSVSDISFSGLTFDGNNLDVVPLTQLFSCSNISFKCCVFKDCGRVAANLSTNITNISFLDSLFSNIGFVNGVGGANAKQAIAFSSGGNSGITIDGCDFDQVGLDCISLDGCSEVLISNNSAKNSYAFCYSALGNINSDISITDNILVGSVNAGGGAAPEPNGIDMPNVERLVISGNIVSAYGSAGIGVFSTSNSVSIVGNVCTNNGQAGSLYQAGIVIKSHALSTGDPSNVIISGNVCTDTQGVKTQDYGILYSSTVKNNITIGADNILKGNLSGDVAEFSYADGADIGALVFTKNHIRSADQHVGYRSGSVWYAPPNFRFAGSPVAASVDILHLTPVTLDAPITVDALGSYVSVGVAATNALFGIYENGATNLPATKIVEVSSPVSGTSIGAVFSTTSATTLSAGTYWLAMVSDGAISFRTYASDAVGDANLGSTALGNVANGANIGGIKMAGTYASGLPSDLTGTGISAVITNNSMPVICFRSQ
jgi:hypothetical protein